MSVASNLPGKAPSPVAQRVLAHLDGVTASPGFTSAPRKAQFLRYLVERALAGHSVTEYAAGVDVFDRPPAFDPGQDSIVRTEATRLRHKLREYYANHSPADGIRIELPLRSYTPVFVASDVASTVRVAGTPRPHRRSGTILAAIGLMVLIAIGLIAWRGSGAKRDSPSVAVLPFLNLTGDAGKEYLSDSITDELTEVLAEDTSLRVIARTSAFQFKGKPLDVREIGRRLGVGKLLEGSIGYNEGRLQLVIQLIDTRTAAHVWAKTYAVTEDELRPSEDEIARSTQRVLLGKTEPSVLSQRPTDPQAHDLYLRAVYFFYKSDPDSLRKALELAHQAVKIDPSFVRPHWLIVKAEHNLAALAQESPADADRNSEADLRAVLALDPSSPEAHALIGFRTYVLQWDWAAAERDFKTALAGSAPSANALNLYAWSLMTRGRFAEAHALFESAMEIDPLVLTGARSNGAIAWLMQRKYPDARRAVDSMLQLSPNSVNAYGLLSWIALAEDDCAAGRGIENRFFELAPAARPLVNPGWEARCGSPEEARRDLSAVVMTGSKPHLAPYQAAEMYGILGDRDHAVEFLNQAADQKSDMVLYLALDPLLDPIRQDPRVQTLARRIGLPNVTLP